MAGQGVCAAKLGKPYQMRECGKPAIYLTAEDLSGVKYSGWFHVDPEDDRDHWPVPKHEL
jgi:hypothetical protein